MRFLIMSDVNAKKKTIKELCAQPMDPEEYEDSWEKQLPNFAKDCNYCPDVEKYKKKG